MESESLVMSEKLLPGIYRCKNDSLVEILKGYDTEDGRLFVGVVLDSKHITDFTPWLWNEDGSINGSQDPDSWQIVREVTRELYECDTMGNVYVVGHCHSRRGSEKFRKILRSFQPLEGKESEKSSGSGP